MTASTHAHIVLDPAILAGKPIVRGTRLSVDFVIGLLADGWSEDQIVENYPGLSHDDVLACLAYVRDMLRASASIRLLRDDALALQREHSTSSR